MYYLYHNSTPVSYYLEQFVHGSFAMYPVTTGTIPHLSHPDVLATAFVLARIERTITESTIFQLRVARKKLARSVDSIHENWYSEGESNSSLGSESAMSCR